MPADQKPPINARVKISRKARGLKFDLSLHTLCMEAMKALASLHICADSAKSLFLVDVISTEISCTGRCFTYFDTNIFG